jgi:hypothetical protein
LNESNEKEGEIPWLPGFIGVDRRLTFGDENAADMASSEKSLGSNIRKLQASRWADKNGGKREEEKKMNVCRRRPKVYVSVVPDQISVQSS